MAAAAAKASPATAAGSVARLCGLFESTGGSQQRSASEQEASPATSGRPQPSKRPRLWPPVIAERSPSDAAGSVAAEDSNGSSTGRRLWPAESDGVAAQGGSTRGSAPADKAARNARLEKIQARFGTKRFLPAKQVPPAELLHQLGAAESDLEDQDYKLVCWAPMPVLLNQTTNAHVKNFVLKGMSGCVGLASSITHVWVLGAGQTIWIADADTVQAERSWEEGVFIRFGQGDVLTLKADEAATTAIMDTINARAAKRAHLRRKVHGDAAGPAAPASAGAASDPDCGVPAAAGANGAGCTDM